MNEKRDVPVGFKLTESEKKKADSISDIYGLSPGSLSSKLLRDFIKAYEEYGESVQFPPRYDVNVEQTPIQKKVNAANELLKQKAG
jgi:hypothetical protein